MYKTIQKIRKYLNEEEYYKMETNLFSFGVKDKFIRLTSLNKVMTVTKFEHMKILYKIVDQKYEDIFYSKMKSVIKENDFIDVKCRFNDMERHYKHHKFNFENEKISYLDISLFKNDDEYILYLIDNLFDDKITIDYRSIHNEYGKRIKTVLSSYVLHNKNRRMSIEDIPYTLELKVMKLIKNKTDGDKNVKRYGKNS